MADLFMAPGDIRAKLGAALGRQVIHFTMMHDLHFMLFFLRNTHAHTRHSLRENGMCNVMTGYCFV